MAMFPPTIPHVFIRWLTQPGEVVYDPFSGRGTTPLEACLLGRIGLGADANPLAALLTAAKTQVPRQEQINRRLTALKNCRSRQPATRVPDEIRMLFTERTLEVLLFLREALDLTDPVDRYLMACLLGGLHGNANTDGTPRGLTIPMPNTFSMAPGYIRRYIEAHNLRPPDVDVIEFLANRVARFPSPGPRYRHGHAWRQLAEEPVHWPPSIPKASLVFTSPPYLEVMKYAKYNWVRLWLLGENAPDVDSELFTSSSLERYLAFMKTVIGHLRSVIRDDGFVCLVIGDVRRGDRQLNLAREVADACVSDSGLAVRALITDRIPVQHKVSRIWKGNAGRATKVDRILVLSTTAAPSLPPLERIHWRLP